MTQSDGNGDGSVWYRFAKNRTKQNRPQWHHFANLIARIAMGMVMR